MYEPKTVICLRCDRCGNEIESRSQFDHWTNRPNHMIVTYHGAPPSFLDFHLCPSCEQELRDWLVHQKRREERSGEPQGEPKVAERCTWWQRLVEGARKTGHSGG